MDYEEFIGLPDEDKVFILDYTKSRDIIEFGLNSETEEIRHAVSGNSNLTEDDLRALSDDYLKL